MAKVAWTIISNQATERGVLAKHVFKLYSDRFDRFKARALLFYFALSDLIDQGCFFPILDTNNRIIVESLIIKNVASHFHTDFRLWLK